jgi:peptide/nickel transport system substrate-binding protein
MTFYGTMATAAGWIVPKKYFEQVGDDGFRKHPIGLGPYKFVSHTPGVELVVEANEEYWRKMPQVKRLVLKSVVDSSTRMAMLKKGEVDVAYYLDAAHGEEVKRDPKLRLAFSGGIGNTALNFLEGQWDPKSPWHDRRVRLAANYAIDRQAISEAETLGASIATGSIIPREFEFALPIEPYPYDPVKAKQLLVEAGYPNGFDAGDLFPSPPFNARGEMVGNYLAAIGIRTRLRTMERAAFQAAQNAKQLRGLALIGSARYGNAATRIEEAVVSTGTFAWGAIPTSMSCLDGKMSKPTGTSARPSCMRFSNRYMSVPCSRPSSSSYGPAGWGRGWRSRDCGSSSHIPGLRLMKRCA